jgi:hypothetical protein
MIQTILAEHTNIVVKEMAVLKYSVSGVAL